MSGTAAPPDDAMDTRFQVWVLAWGTHALATAPLRLFQANIFHPFPNTLALGDQSLAWQPLFAPTYFATGNPILSANVAILIMHPIVAIAGFALARRWVGFVPAVVCGLLYAFPARSLRTIGWFIHLLVACVPLLALFGERWLDRGRTRDAVGLAASIALQTLASFYLAYDAAFALGAWLVVGLASRRFALDRRRWAGLVLAVTGGVLPFLVTAMPVFHAKRLGLIRPFDEANPALGLVPPWASAIVFDWVAARGVPRVAWLLAGVALASGWRRLGRPLAIGLAWTVTGLFLAFAGPISIGSFQIWTPYRWLAAIVPGLDSVRLPDRFLVVATAGVALLAAVGLQALFDKSRRIGVFASMVFGVLTVRFLSSQPPLLMLAEITPPDVPPVHAHLARFGNGRALAEIPTVPWTETTRRMIASTVHWLPMVDGYSGYPPPGGIIGLVARLPDRDALGRLVREYGVRLFLVHTAELPEEARAAWTDPTPDGLRLEGRFGDDLLFAATDPPDPERLARTIDESRTPGGVPLLPLGSECRGRIVPSFAQPPGSTLPRNYVHLAVELSNEGPVDWPGDSLFPGHLVEGRTRVLGAGGLVLPPAPFPIGGDLGVGQHRRVEAGVSVEGVPPGKYEIRIELAQPLDGSLERCGVAAVTVPLDIPAPRGPAGPMPRPSHPVIRRPGTVDGHPAGPGEALVPSQERATTAP